MEYYHIHIPRDGEQTDLTDEQRWRIRDAIRSALDDITVEPIEVWRPNPRQPGDMKLTPWRLK